VRFGRVPKREKAKILAAMQSSKAKVLESRVLTEMADDRKIIDTIVRAHYDTCDYTVEKIKPFVSRAHANPKLTQCSGQRCPLKGSPEMSFLDEFSDRFMDHVRQVCTFAKLIPGFKCLQHDDQVTLLKSCVFEVLTVRLSGLFDNQSLVCMNGDVIRRETISAMPAGNAKFLMDNVFELTQRINRFSLSDAEIGLFCAVVIISADRPGLRNPELVGRMQTKLKNILQSILVPQHPHHTAIFTELVAITQDLRTLNTLHTEKFLLQAKVLRDEVVGSASPLPPTSTATIVGQSYVDREWEDNTNSLDRDSTGSRSPQSSSDSPATSHSFSMEDLRRSPLGSVSSSESIANSETFSKLSVNDLKIHGSVLLNALTSPALSQQLGAAAANSASQQLHQHQPLPAGGSGSLAQQQQHHIQNLNQSSNSSSSRKRDLSSRNENVRSSESRHQQQTQAEDSSCSSASGSIGAPESKCPYKARKLDSPSDSGIDSPKAQGSHSTNTSVCSSPRSSMEENQGGEDSERPDLEEQHPLLKRALQQPPQPFNMGGVANFQDEVYKPHKKFRHSDRKDGDEPTSSTQDGAPGAVSPSSSLVHTHSILASQLAAPPTYQRRPSPPPSALSSALSSSNGNSNACNVSSSQQQAGSSSAGVTTLSSHAGTYHLHPQSLLATTLSRPVAVQRAKRDEERSELLANLILDSGRYRPSLSSSHHLSHHQKSQSSLLMCAITSPASSPLPAHTASESRPWSPASSGSSAVSAAPQQPAVGSRHLPVPVAPSHSTSSTAGSGLAALSTAAAAQKKLLHDNSAATAAFRGASDSEDFMPLNLCVKSGDGPSAPAVTNSTTEAQEQLCTAAVKKEPIGTSGAM